MSIVDHILKIENLVQQQNVIDDEESLMATGTVSGLAIAGQNSDVPWIQVTPWAMQQDTDGDGIPDALDNHVGPGAYEHGHSH